MFPSLLVAAALTACQPSKTCDTASDADCDGLPSYEDCNDADASINHDAIEICGGIDEDCDGELDDLDEDLDLSTAATWYADGDGDGTGDPDDTIAACEAPRGYVAEGTDCDDGDAAVHPDAPEVCNLVDDDCDGAMDDADPSLDLETGSAWHADADEDGFGAQDAGTVACEAPTGFLADDSDCDDDDEAVHPAALEVCNGIDDDCDGATDDADADLDLSTASAWQADADADGFGDADTTTLACVAPTGFVVDASDCDDTSAAVNPDATETCSGVDDDCDGVADSTALCPCAVEYNEDTAHPYMFCTPGKDWEQAEAVCTSVGYHLATVDDETENDWLYETAYDYNIYYWWIGYNDLTTEGTWGWIDGSSSSYSNWGGGQPSNSGGKEDCAHFDAGNPSSKWNDLDCTTTQNYVCEGG